ncbi:MAG TPA: HupE/UreJ family protein [Beijerinckiaceae bacterium]|mgnify:CR=1 FL=1|nr:HupE/UreJ family protein [Beijerinckiaceae bacterium]
MKRFYAILFALASGPALAHVGADADHAALAAGFWHPLGGADHSLAMVAVGLVAARAGGRGRYGIPGAFLAAMTVGFVLGATRIAVVPAHEAMILASVIGLGLALALAHPLPAAAAGAAAALFGLAHGFAHGVEGTLQLGYGAGFVAATALLHCAGLLIGMAMQAFRHPVLFRLAGAGFAVAGLALAAAR